MFYNFAADSFHTKKLCSMQTFFKRSPIFFHKSAVLRLSDPLWGT